MNLTETLEKIRPCIVQIQSDVQISSRIDDYEFHVPKYEILGTGFFVHQEGYVLTADHVIDYAFEKASQYPEETIIAIKAGLATPNKDSEQVGGTKIFLTMRGCFHMVQCDIVDRDIQHDLALLKLRENPFTGELKPITLFSFGPESNIDDVPWDFLYGLSTIFKGRPKEGADIAVSGYPFESPVLITNSGIIASSWASRESSFNYRTKFVAPKMGESPNIYLADFQANPFNSGGPVYLVENAEIVGLLSSSLSSHVWDENYQDVNYCYDSGLSVVIPSTYIIDFLKKNGLDIN